MPPHIFTSRPNKHGETLVLDTSTMIATIEDPSETPNEWTRIKLRCLKTPDYSDPWTEDRREEIEQFVPQSYMESLEYSDYFGEHILCLVNTANPDKIMSLDVTYEDEDDEDEDSEDLIHHFQRTLKTLHARINTLHARVQHHEHIKTLAEINKRIKYLENEIHILKNLGRITGKPNTTQIKRCEDELNGLINEKGQRLHSNLSTHAHTDEKGQRLHSNLSTHAHTGIIKVAINEKFSGFRVSPEGIRLYEQISGQPFPDHGFHESYEYQYRTDPYLRQVIEALKDRASASGAELVIKQIPSDIDWHIHSYDGHESIYKKVDGTDYELKFDGSWRDTSDDDPND